MANFFKGQVLAYMRAYYIDTGALPSMNQIMIHTGVNVVSVSYRVNALAEAGYFQRDHRWLRYCTVNREMMLHGHPALR